MCESLTLRESKCDYLLIQFWVIDFVYLLDSRDLDCHESANADSRNDEVGAIHIFFGLLCQLRFLAMTGH